MGTSNGLTTSTTFTVNVIAVDDKPYVANAITVSDQQEDASNYDIDLTNVSDVDNEDAQITKTLVSNSDEAIIIATINDNTLTLDFQQDANGTCEISVMGTSNGLTTSTTFTVNVIAVDDKPYVANAITVSDQQEDASNY
ncbi:MAG: hypothetical protein OMM_15238, partial [Candidatus Magnetoglobus multicellularis str. Araruama]